MLTFERFLADAAVRGEAVNTLFEERLFTLVGILNKATGALVAEHIPHEVVGGVAAMIRVEEARPDVMVVRVTDLLPMKLT
jgi:hypothetical protein